jgi:muconolactone D-isomerase
MDYLVTMTTHVPDGTPEGTVEDVRTREAARSRELGLWRARDAAEMQAIVESLPLTVWMTTDITQLTPHPSDPPLTRS